MPEAIRLERPKRGWKCSVCGAIVSTRCTAEDCCKNKLKYFDKDLVEGSKEYDMYMNGDL